MQNPVMHTCDGVQTRFDFVVNNMLDFNAAGIWTDVSEVERWQKGIVTEWKLHGNFEETWSKGNRAD